MLAKKQQVLIKVGKKNREGKNVPERAVATDSLWQCRLDIVEVLKDGFEFFGAMRLVEGLARTGAPSLPAAWNGQIMAVPGAKAWRIHRTNAIFNNPVAIGGKLCTICI